MDLADCPGESRVHASRFRATHQPRVDVSLVGKVDLGERLVAFFELHELETRCLVIQIPETNLQCSRTSLGHKEPEALDNGAAGFALAPGIEPDQTEGQRRI